MLCGAAHAQTSEFYVAGDLGQSRYNDISVVQSTGRVIGGQIDRNGTAGSVAVGWQVLPRIALELGYADFGKVDLSGRGAFPCQPAPTCVPFAGALSGNFQTKTTHLSMVASAPIANDFSFFGRIGLANTKRSASVAIGGFGGNGTETKTEGIFGVGAAYAFSKTIDGVVEWKWMEKSQVNAATLGIRVRF
jgi:hypothetical protein